MTTDSKPLLTENLKQRAKTLKLHGLLTNWDELNKTMVPWVISLIEWEETERNQRGLERRMNSAKIGRFKSLDDFDWEWLKQLDRGTISELMTLSFINQASNAVL
jgi:hypothetical protein